MDEIRKEQRRQAQKRYQDKNKEKMKLKNSEYYQKNKDKFKKLPERDKEYKKKYRTTEKYREARLQYIFGVGLDWYKQTLETQGNVCAICENPETIQDTWLCVDHCHTTGQLRGLLCRACNLGLGKFKDSKELLKRAIEYLDGPTYN